MVYWGWLGSHPATILLKYLGQSVSTLRILFRETPDAVFVMSPPPVAICPVYLYCLMLRRRFVIDAHTGAFLDRWRRLQGLQFWFCRRAATTIVSNTHWAKLVEAHGGHATIVPDVPIQFDSNGKGPASMTEFTVVCVTSYDRDEPIEAIVEAARRLPGIPFVMTGDPSRAAKVLPRDLPPNLALTGFLSTAAYGDVLKNAGVVLALTTAEHTMQRGAYEAIYQGTPVIVSDNPLLRAAFDDGAVHVDNGPDAIVEAVQQVRGVREAFRDGANRLKRRKYERWIETKSALLNALTDSTSRR